MTHWVLGTLAALACAGAALSASAQEQGSIPGVIRQQIDAFGAGDIATAWRFASPTIQGLFGDPDNFARMVQEGYPMVWQPGAIRFGGLTEEDGQPTQRVFVSDADGVTHVLDYLMEQIDGAWRIAGVRYVERPDLTA